MIYQFELETINAKKGKLSREERNDITKYFEETRVEAADERRAFRQLASLSNGRLSRDSQNSLTATITLPDYSNCQIILKIR